MVFKGEEMSKNSQLVIIGIIIIAVLEIIEGALGFTGLLVKIFLLMTGQKEVLTQMGREGWFDIPMLIGWSLYLYLGILLLRRKQAAYRLHLILLPIISIITIIYFVLSHSELIFQTLIRFTFMPLAVIFYLSVPKIKNELK